jgi:HlyD family secretion protein
LNEARAAKIRTERTLNAQLAEAQATLEEKAEVRPVDVQIAQAELKQAQASVGKAQADMELAYVRAPVDGEVLDIHTRPGEALDEKGIAEIGQTDQMMVVAEIDQNDINQVKIGQKAAVTSAGKTHLKRSESDKLSLRAKDGHDQGE